MRPGVALCAASGPFYLVMSCRRKYPKRPAMAKELVAGHIDCPQCGRDGHLRKNKGIEPNDICWFCVNSFRVKCAE